MLHNDEATTGVGAWQNCRSARRRVAAVKSAGCWIAWPLAREHRRGQNTVRWMELVAAKQAGVHVQTTAWEATARWQSPGVRAR